MNTNSFVNIVNFVRRAFRGARPAGPSNRRTPGRQLGFRKRDVSVTVGTSLQGYVRVRYTSLVETLGQPEELNPETPACWSLQFEDGTVASVYVHKPAEYGYRPGEIPTDVYCWHVGGQDIEALFHVAELFGAQPIPPLTSEILENSVLFEHWRRLRKGLTEMPWGSWFA